ncbi:MAG: hypothetical protein AVDCRST_MAG88-419 [uncultured Thermomicrobiales bacterium]|uniref:Uncharacterized protein n=1 Tax=uncultured Thermomicrobiales bacterium TaxID=1645740 RepID=A0A6J4UCF4_9BACT|nr:MAG: hypothetical protein AVDCRST_MAG88-419 [uncultured Thermomicrobiales bacterium]
MDERMAPDVTKADEALARLTAASFLARSGRSATLYGKARGLGGGVVARPEGLVRSNARGSGGGSFATATRVELTAGVGR